MVGSCFVLLSALMIYKGSKDLNVLCRKPSLAGYMTPYKAWCALILARNGDIWQAYFICTPNLNHFQVTFKFLESFITHVMSVF